MDKIEVPARFDRVHKIFGDKFFEFSKVKILLLGVGGVGSFCLDCLYRSGIQNITIVDFDTYDETNQNRQLESEKSENLEQFKVEVLAKKYPEISFINAKIDLDWVQNFDFGKFDFVLDAVDEVSVKVQLPITINWINRTQKRKIEFISSMGSAMKTDPTLIKITDIWKTKEDGLARKIRTELRKKNFNKKYKVVFSEESPHGELKGSFMGVTASFGLVMCSAVLNKLTALD